MKNKDILSNSSTDIYEDVMPYLNLRHKYVTTIKIVPKVRLDLVAREIYGDVEYMAILSILNRVYACDDISHKEEWKYIPKEYL